MRKNFVKFNIFEPEEPIVVSVANGKTLQEFKSEKAGTELTIELREKE